MTRHYLLTISKNNSRSYVKFSVFIEEYRTLYYDLDRINNDNGLYLAVNTSTGEVTVNLTEGKELNREDPKLASFLVTIIVRDNFENFIECKCSPALYIIDIDTTAGSNQILKKLISNLI